ncbi:hypothetical protein VTO73DRAFT_9275 [Trametes versicolor]
MLELAYPLNANCADSVACTAVHASRCLPRSSSARLKNIEETEKAKCQIAEQRKDKQKQGDDEAHLAGSQFYRPNLRAKSDTDILRDAKLEAMGLNPEDHEVCQHSDRPQMAMDEMVMERFKKRM